MSFLLVLLFQAPQVAPLASLPPTLRQLREHLEEHRPTFGATPELTAAKHQLRDWVESRLDASGENVDMLAIAETLHTALGGANYCRLQETAMRVLQLERLAYSVNPH